MEDDESVSLCERILSDLGNIFNRDSNILDFDIIDVGDSTCNKSPVVYIDHHLGLEKWCIPHLYNYVYNKFLQFKLHIQRTGKFDLSTVHQWSRILLLINPDLISAWNLRRDIINSNVQTYQDDLKFTELVLIRKPKCATVFNYREWLLNSVRQINTNNNEFNTLVEKELEVTLNAASRYARNYYAWSHRTWILTIFIANCVPQYIQNKIIRDLEITEKWLECHISDYSCFQHRQCLFGYLFGLDSKSDLTELYSAKSHMLKEFQLLNSLFRLYPEQESLFLHRRFLLHSATRWCSDQLENLYALEMDFQREHISPILQQCDPNSWQCEIIKRYQAYLKRNLSWSFES